MDRKTVCTVTRTGLRPKVSETQHGGVTTSEKVCAYPISRRSWVEPPVQLGRSWQLTQLAITEKKLFSADPTLPKPLLQHRSHALCGHPEQCRTQRPALVVRMGGTVHRWSKGEKRRSPFARGAWIKINNTAYSVAIDINKDTVEAVPLQMVTVYNIDKTCCQHTIKLVLKSLQRSLYYCMILYDHIQKQRFRTGSVMPMQLVVDNNG